MYNKVATLIFARRSFSLKEQTFFARRLAFLMTAGVPLVESLSIVTEQMHARVHASTLRHILRSVEAGQTLSNSFTQFPGIFSEFGVHIVAIGESSGMLPQSLEYLAQELQKRQSLKSKVLGALLYPAVIAVATFGITLFLVVYLFPKISPMFASLQVPLPWSTRALMSLSGFVVHWGVWLVVACALMGVLCAWAVRRVALVRQHIHRMLCHVPLFGSLYRSYQVATICRTLGILLQSGVPVSEALRVCANTAQEQYKQRVLLLAAGVDRGESLSPQLLAATKLFPDTVGHLVAVGERSGTLSKTLLYLGSMYESEVDEATKNMSTLVEPILMLGMGLVVGFIAVSIITPIYSITQNLHV